MTPRRQHASRPAVFRPAAQPSCRRALAQRAKALLRDTHGFMLAEQLISIIFIGLLCVAVAAGLQAALSSYSAITTQTAANALLSNAVEVVSNELAYALEVEDAGGDASTATTPAFVSATTHSKVTMTTQADAGIVLNPASGATTAPMTLVANNASANLNVSVSFGGYNAETNKALPAYDKDAKTWSFTIQVQPANAQGTSGVLASTAMTVKRIG